MTILVTGSAGFFGSWLVPGLKALGYDIDGYDLKNGDDLFDTEKLADRAARCDGVIHLAAIPHYKPEIPAEAFQKLNVEGTKAVWEAAWNAGITRFVYTSSGAIYGFGPTLPLEGWATPPITEEMSADPGAVDAYGQSKLDAEAFLAEQSAWRAVTALRINCIEPHHDGARLRGAHWGWWCSQALAIRAYAAALERASLGFVAVNVGEANENLDTLLLGKLLEGSL